MIIMYGDCDIDEKTQVLRKTSEAEKCFARNSDGMPIIESVILNILADDVPACQLALLQNQRLLKSKKLRKLILKISAKFEEPAINEIAKTLMEE